MPRARDDKKEALLTAAIRVFTQHGLAAPTAMIAKEANVANGTLFNNFATKTDLLNHLYLQLKQEVVDTAMSELPPDVSLKQQAHHMWSRWTHWGADFPDKRRTLELLSLSDEVTVESKACAAQSTGCIADIIAQGASAGHLREQPLPFVYGILDALANMTINFMIDEPEKAKHHSDVGFETFWRAIS